MGHNSLTEMLFIGAWKLNQILIWLHGHLSVFFNLQTELSSEPCETKGQIKVEI